MEFALALGHMHEKVEADSRGDREMERWKRGHYYRSNGKVKEGAVFQPLKS